MMWRTPKITIVSRTIIRATVKRSKTKYLHWIMFVHSFCSFISTSSLAQQLMCSLLCAHVHVRDGRSSFKVYANFCNCLFVRTHSLFLNGRANAAEIFRFYGTYICQSHTICKDLFPSHTHTHMHIFALAPCVFASLHLLIQSSQLANSYLSRALSLPPSALSIRLSAFSLRRKFSI